MESITNLLRALAEAIRPYLGLDDNGGVAVVEAIEGLDDHVEALVLQGTQRRHRERWGTPE